MADSLLIAFYRGARPDTAGRMIGDIWALNHKRLETVHDYIQWLFPLPEASRFNPAAPLLTSADKKAFRADPELQERMRRSFDLMLAFFGLVRSGTGIIRNSAFDNAHWVEPLNHNHLRLTRMLLSLRHAGLDAEARALSACLLDIAGHEGKTAISPRTLTFWREAMDAMV